MTFQEISASAALKEWALVGEALAQDRQIILLRKGGLLDEDGSFHLEHREFLLLPTFLHQDKQLVKAEHRDLFDQVTKKPDESLQVSYLRHFARVEKIWTLHGEAEQALADISHIWSGSYLDLRFGYKPEKPLLCAAVRLYVLEEPIRYELRPEDSGCRSWVEWEAPMSFRAAPVISDQQFVQRLTEVAEVLE